MTILVCTTASDFFGGKYDRYQDDADLSELPFYDSMCLLLSLIHISEPTRPY